MEIPISLSLVIPCYNEAPHLEQMFDTLRDFASRWSEGLEIIAIDDGSTDETATILQQEMGNGILPLSVYILPSNCGKGAALKEGVSHATGEVVLTLDADMAARPHVVLEWMAERDLQKRDVIYIGSREHERSIIDAASIRKMSGRLFNGWTRWVTGLSELDTQCGFKCYPLGIAKRLFSNLEEVGWAHDVELLCLARKMNIQIVSMPLTWTHQDNSKIRLLRDGVQMAWKIVLIAYRVRKLKLPK